MRHSDLFWQSTYIWLFNQYFATLMTSKKWLIARMNPGKVHIYRGLKKELMWLVVHSFGAEGGRKQWEIQCLVIIVDKRCKLFFGARLAEENYI